MDGDGKLVKVNIVTRNYLAGLPQAFRPELIFIERIAPDNHKTTGLSFGRTLPRTASQVLFHKNTAIREQMNSERMTPTRPRDFDGREGLRNRVTI